MISQGVTVTDRCDTCGGVRSKEIVQRLDEGAVGWATEARCAGCSDGLREEDTGGATPEEIRRLLLAEHGPARLSLTGAGANLISVTRVLRQAHGLSMGEARDRAAELRTTGLVGTLVEMEWLATALRQRAVEVTVVPERAV